MSIIKLQNVSKYYEGKHIATEVFNNISIDIDEGEFVTVMGRSGSGKSTLLHIMGLIAPPTSGQVFLNGIDVSKLRDKEYAKIRNKHIGFVFQDFRLINDMTVFENVEVPLALSDRKISKQKRYERVSSLLSTVNLLDKAKAYPMELSGGQKQRIAIARALINEPTILFADEPTGNLDQTSAISIMNLLKSLNEGNKLTVVLITHDPDIMQFGTRTILIDGINKNMQGTTL